MENNINQKFDLQDKLDISSPEKFIKNTDHFNSLMMRYRCAIREIRTKLEVLNDEFSIKYNRNPISSIKSRIKFSAWDTTLPNRTLRSSSTMWPVYV